MEISRYYNHTTEKYVTEHDECDWDVEKESWIGEVDSKGKDIFDNDIILCLPSMAKLRVVIDHNRDVWGIGISALSTFNQPLGSLINPPNSVEVIGNYYNFIKENPQYA